MANDFGVMSNRRLAEPVRNAGGPMGGRELGKTSGLDSIAENRTPRRPRCADYSDVSGLAGRAGKAIRRGGRGRKPVRYRPLAGYRNEHEDPFRADYLPGGPSTMAETLPEFAGIESKRALVRISGTRRGLLDGSFPTDRGKTLPAGHG